MVPFGAVAPTVIADRADPGEPTERMAPLFPAASANTTPAAVALSTARDIGSSA